MREENIEMPDGTILYMNLKIENTQDSDLIISSASLTTLIYSRAKQAESLEYYGEVTILIQTLKIIYDGLVEAHLNYGIIRWASTFAKIISNIDIQDHVPDSLQKIVKTQNEVIRVLFRKPTHDRKAKVPTRATILYNELNILRLCDLYYYNLAILGHNYFHNKTLP